MKRALARRRSWLLVLGLVCVFAAVGGAYAATQRGSSGPSTSTAVRVNLSLQPGASRFIGVSGPLRITAVCNAGTPPTAEYVLHTNASHTSMDAGPQNDDFGPGDISFWGPISTYEANFEGGAAFSHQFLVESLNTSLAGGSNVQNAGFCVFGGVFVFSEGPLP